MPDLRRRAGEPHYEDPTEQSLVRRMSKMELPGGPIVDVLIRVTVVLLMGGGAGFVANEHASAGDAIQAERLQKLRQDFDEFRIAYVKTLNESAAYEQKDREEELQRLSAIETELRLLRSRR